MLDLYVKNLICELINLITNDAEKFADFFCLSPSSIILPFEFEFEYVTNFSGSISGNIKGTVEQSSTP